MGRQIQMAVRSCRAGLTGSVRIVVPSFIVLEEHSDSFHRLVECASVRVYTTSTRASLVAYKAFSLSCIGRR